MNTDRESLESERNYLAALALVDTALLGIEEDSKISLHPKLKKRIAEEIVKNPALTKDLFSSNFFNKFLKNILEKEIY